MSRNITIDIFDPASVDAAVKEIREYSRWVQSKTIELRERVAELISDQAHFEFHFAIASDTFKVIDGNNTHSEGPILANVSVTTEPGNDSTLVIAHGSDAVWIEFGAGVHYNGGVGSYPNPLAASAGMVAIGTYGKGNGAKEVWGYLDDDGKVHLTRGTPASMPLYKALLEVSRDIVQIAREVFADD